MMTFFFWPVRGRFRVNHAASTMFEMSPVTLQQRRYSGRAGTSRILISHSRLRFGPKAPC
jgi:hypothetical protein